MAAFAESEHIHIYDYEDEDAGTESSIKVGLRFAFGGVNDGNLLAMGAFNAAGWMGSLD